MSEHPAVADRLRRWGRHLRGATTVTLLVVASIVPTAPVGTADPGTATDVAAVHDVTVRAPLPSNAGSDDVDALAGSPVTTTPNGHLAEITTVALAGHPPVPGIGSTQAPLSAPTGSGLTRAPPQRFTH